MRRFVFVCLSFLLVLRGWAPLRAQTTDNFPVQCTPLINTAYSLNLTDYATNTQMLTVQLRLKDLTKPQLQLYLKLRIEGVGIVIQTREGHIPSQPLTLLPGQAITLHGPDLAESFYPTNLDIQGLDPAFLFQGGTLPEGLYRVYFQAFDFDRGRAVSNEGVALVNVFKRQPPLLLYPQDRSTLKPTLPQNLLLQWLPRDMASLNAASGGSTYTLRLYEVLDEDTDVNSIAQSQLPILEKTLPATSYFLGPSDVTLVAGRKYVWQVTVSSLDGRDVFLNGGRSQVSSFRYGGNCDPPASITVLGRGNGGVLLSWPGGEDAIRYVLRYRQESSTEWSQKVVYSTGTELSGLADGVYVYQVGSVCSGERAGAFSSEAGIGVVGGEASPVSLGGSSSARVASVAGVAGGASSGATAPTPVPTPEEEALNRLLNPGSVLVNTSVVKTEDMVKATLASLSKLVPPPCAGQVVTDPSCVSVAITYSGSPKGSLSVGDVLYVNTYQVVLTQVSGGGGTFSGEGIVTFPYLNNALFAVDFKNISVVGSVEQPGGCVTVGELVVAGSSNAALDQAVQTRLAALYQKAQAGAQKDEFVGKLSDALEALKAKAVELQNRPADNPPSKADFRELVKNLKAIETYLKAFDGDLTTIFPSDSPELANLQAAVAAQKILLAECKSCFDEQLQDSSVPEKSKGPWWDETNRWLGKACVESTLKKTIELAGETSNINNAARADLNDLSAIPLEEWLVNSAPTYQTDGHYGTVYLVSLMLGLNNAKELAEATEAPDNIIKTTVAELVTTWLDANYQRMIHALTYGFHEEEELRTSMAIYACPDSDIRYLGQLLHRLGDTYAHTRLEDSLKREDLMRMYGKVVDEFNKDPKGAAMNIFYGGATAEHTSIDGRSVGSAPDLIKNRPEWYLKYVQSLVFHLATKFGVSTKNVDWELFRKLAYYAKNNNASLMGIIHYHIAKYQGKKEFMLPYPVLGTVPFGHLPVASIALSDERKSYEVWIKNTVKYIREDEHINTLIMTRRTKDKIIPPSGPTTTPITVKYFYEAKFTW